MWFSAIVWSPFVVVVEEMPFDIGASEAIWLSYDAVCAGIVTVTIDDLDEMWNTLLSGCYDTYFLVKYSGLSGISDALYE
jgi:hypothetical protein